MLYRYQQKMGGLLFGATVVLLASTLWQQRGAIRSGSSEWLLLVLLGVLALGMIAWRYLVLVGVRTDDQGLTIVRRGFSDIHLPWAGLIVSYRAEQRRTAAGLLVERGEGEEPYFLLLKDLENEEKLREDMRTRLGERYLEEG